MAYTTFENGKVFFHDQTKNDEKTLLADFVSPEVNRSIISSHQYESDEINYPLFTEIQKYLPKFSDGNFINFVNGIIFFRLAAELLKKSQIHNILHVGTWSAIDEILDGFLPKFNEKNFLYCLTDRKPLQKLDHTKFIFADGEKYFLPKNEFETIIFSEISPPPPEIILAAKNFGKIYFVCNEKAISEEMKANSKIFVTDENFSLFELSATKSFKRIIVSRTEEGILAEKKSQIARIIFQVPAISTKISSLVGEEKVAQTDALISALVRAEKILAEIFPQLRSDTVKFNVNLLKEFLIDFRLRIHSSAWKISASKFAEQYKILIDDMQKDFA